MKRLIVFVTAYSCCSFLFGQNHFLESAQLVTVSCHAKIDEEVAAIEIMGTKKHSELDLRFVQPQSNLIFQIDELSTYSGRTNIANVNYELTFKGMFSNKEMDARFVTSDFNTEVRFNGVNKVLISKLASPITVYFEKPIDRLICYVARSGSFQSSSYHLKLTEIGSIRNSTIIPNPIVNVCIPSKIVIGLDASGSISGAETKEICEKVTDLILGIIKQNDVDLSVVEFDAVCKTTFHESFKQNDQAAIDKLKSYLDQIYNQTPIATDNDEWTNWSEVFKMVSETSPNVFLFITDGWQNFAHGLDMSAKNGIEELIKVSNKIKANGTRLIVIGKNLSGEYSDNFILEKLTDGKNATWSYNEKIQNGDWRDVDYVIVNEFENIPSSKLAELFSCPIERSENEPWAYISVYPNPASKEFSIDLSKYKDEKFESQLLDATGKKITGYTRIAQQDGVIKLSITDAGAGNYFLVLRSPHTTLIASIALISNE